MINSLAFKTLLIYLSTIFAFNILAQDVKWAKGIGGIYGDVGNAITVDKDGNVYTTGYYSGVVDFDPSAATYTLGSPSSDEIFITKFSSSGSFIWAKRMGGNGPEQGYAITVDTIGNVYTAGYFNSSVADFDPSAATFTLGVTGNNGDVFISKLDPNGNFVWAKRIGTLANDFCYTIDVDLNQNVFITGSYSSTMDFDPGPATYTLTSTAGDDVYILKLDVNGAFAWVKTFEGTGSDYAQCLKTDKTGNIFITGSFTGYADFDTGPGYFGLGSTIGTDIYVCKLDNNGNFMWATSIAGTGSNTGQSIALDTAANIYACGYFNGTANFDNAFGQYNLTSNGFRDCFIMKINPLGTLDWARNIGSAGGDEYARSIAVDYKGTVYTTGYFGLPIDFDPGVNSEILTPMAASWDAFISVLDTYGNYVDAGKMGGIGSEYALSITVDKNSEIYTTGFFQSTVSFTPSTTPAIISAGGSDIFIAKHRVKGVSGYIFNDINNDCIRQNNEAGLKNRRAILTPDNIVVETDYNGRWYVDSLSVGTYTITYDLSGHWNPTCPTTINFSVTNTNAFTLAPDFGLITTDPCAQPEVSIVAPVLRRCFSNQIIYVQACNLPIATSGLINAYVDVELDTRLSADSASIPFTPLGNNRFRFMVNTINPDQCVNFNINTTLSCIALFGQTLCMKAELFPADTCVFDITPAQTLPAGSGTGVPCNLPWDNSHMEVNAYCLNDSVHFTIINTGTGNMQCSRPVRVYINDTLTHINSVQLNTGQTISYSYPGIGKTWIFQADQHPLHPGNSTPTTFIEACGDTLNWVPNLVNNFPLNDVDPVVDEYCGLVTGSYDPNDKTGYPFGVGTSHDILPNEQLQYIIRFQNTGLDTAFTVVIRDTLDMDLNIFSVVSGVSSHNYTFRMYGPRVLEWTFNNILLPDSNVNEPASHGFVSFRVDQNLNLPNGTTILNEADIYFDFNVPVITNQTNHTINNQLHNSPTITRLAQNNINSTINMYPNPANHLLTIELNKERIGSAYSICNQLGQTILKGKLSEEKNSIDLNNLVNGFYVIIIEGKQDKQSLKLIKQ